MHNDPDAPRSPTNTNSSANGGDQFFEVLRQQRPIQKAEEYWHRLGPGLTTGAADDDPSGITTYSQAGARYGYQFLWLATFTFPLMAMVQEMCARIGLVTGQGLAGNIKDRYPRWVLYGCTALLMAANTFNIGADLGAMAKATELVLPRLDFIVLIIFFTIVCLGLQIFTSYRLYAKYLKWLALILLAYVLTAFFVDLDFGILLPATIIPRLTFSRDQIFLVTGVLGTTISPYLFFWQTSQEIEEEVAVGKTTIKSRRGSTPEAIRNMRVDVWSGMFVSNVVMFFIIAVCAATLFENGVTNIGTAADAAAALRPLVGAGAELLFAVGIIGTGLLAVPVLAASASYALAESLNWKEGLYRKLNDAYAFYGVIVVSMLVGLGLNFIGLDPIKALIYSAVANGLVAPVVLALIVHMSSQKKVMGEWVNRPLTTAFGWFLTALMTVSGLATIASVFL